MGETIVKLITPDGVCLEASLWKGASPRAILIWLHGYASHRGRYSLFVRWMTEHGIAVLTPDLRGHGNSEGIRGHINDFSDFFNDLSATILLANRALHGLPVFLGAHSHGALVAGRYLEEVRDLPGRLDGVIMTGPFMGMGKHVPDWKMRASRIIASLFPSAPLPTPVRAADKSRDKAIVEEFGRDAKVFHYVRARWFQEALKNHRLVVERAGHIHAPILVLQGLRDTMVSVDASRRFFAALGSDDREWIEYEGFLHEILKEIGRERVYEDILRWIEKHIGPSKKRRKQN